MNVIAKKYRTSMKGKPLANGRGQGARAHGFTLVELMITVAIIAILAAIALPNYQDSVRKSRRATAKTALLDLASRQEKYYSMNNKYTTLATLGITNAAISDSSGRSYYTLTVTASTGGTSVPGTTYLATATATGDQASDTLACRIYSINNFGQQSPAATTGCW